MKYIVVGTFNKAITFIQFSSCRPADAKTKSVIFSQISTTWLKALRTGRIPWVFFFFIIIHFRFFQNSSLVNNENQLKKNPKKPQTH